MAGISMREAARVLGVSQLRVRELIRKGTLAAEKVAGDGGERWEIHQGSVVEYLGRRGQAGDAIPPAAVSPAAGPTLPALIDGLEQQTQRIGALIEEIEKSQAYLDGLRGAQRALQSELAEARKRVTAASPKPETETPKAKKPEPPKPEAKKPEDPKPEAPKPEAKKAAKTSKKKTPAKVKATAGARSKKKSTKK